MHFMSDMCENRSWHTYALHLVSFWKSGVTDWDCTKEKMEAYCSEVRKLEAKFDGIEYHHILRDYNVAADVLAKLGSKRALVPSGVFVQGLLKPTVPDPLVDEPVINPAFDIQHDKQVMVIEPD